MFLFVILFIIFSSGVQADIFDDPQNLKVLKKEISAAELRGTMKMISRGLDVRCQHCHVGQEGQPLKDFDFASDEKENKLKARFMLKMMMDLNQRLSSDFKAEFKERSVEIQCATCHRGTLKPYQTVELLKIKVEEQGVDKALEFHDELKAKYYGSGTHDFTERTLNGLAAMIKKDHPDAVQKVLLKNLEIYPTDFTSLVNVGDLYAKQKDYKKAIKYLKKAQKVNNPPWLEEKIKSIKEQR